MANKFLGFTSRSDTGLADQARVGPRAVYYVVRAKGHWKIEAGSMNLGPYSTRSEAVHTAIEAATGASQNGQPAQVVAQTEGDGWDTMYPVTKSGW